MSGLTSFWQRIYYNVFKFFAFLAHYMGNPVFVPFGNKQPYPTKSVMAAVNGRSESKIMRCAAGVLIVFGCFAHYTIVTLMSAMIGFRLITILKNQIVFMCFFIIPSLVINYLLLWRKNKYLDYFKKFDKESTFEKRKWGWISFGVLVGIVLLMIWSFEVSSRIKNR